MFYLRRTLRFVSVMGVLSGAIVPNLSRAELSSTSPFLPPQGQAVAAPTTPPPLELRGITTFEDVTMFSIFDATAKKPAAWLKLNETGPGFSIKSFDSESDTVSVDYQGRTLKLVMRTPKIASAGPAMPASPLGVPLALQTSAVTNLVARPTVPSVAPATDAARMKEWTDEIERRRTVRNQAPGTAATPATGATAVPQPQTS
ncbi:MAG: hypothetical protein ABIZ81_07715, partial [Opitutaceae bacterium]